LNLPRGVKKREGTVNNQDSNEKIGEGIRLFKQRRWESALQEFLKVDIGQVSSGESTETAYYLGLCYMKLDRFDDALLYLEQVVTGSAEPLRVYQCRLTLAYVYVKTKRAKLAEFELRHLVQSGFESAQIYATMGYAAWIQKQYKEAVDYYEKALQMDENNATAMNSLGYVLVDANIDIARGIRFCRKAVEKSPQNAAYLDSLGWGYYKSGDYQEARVWLRRAFDLAPHHPVVRAHMRLVVGENS
jgi:tetratricopeptide (TPR) repeat protein